MQDAVTVAAVANSSFSVIYKRLDSDSPKKFMRILMRGIWSFLNTSVCAKFLTIFYLFVCTGADMNQNVNSVYINQC